MMIDRLAGVDNGACRAKLRPTYKTAGRGGSRPGPDTRRIP